MGVYANGFSRGHKLLKRALWVGRRFAPARTYWWNVEWLTRHYRGACLQRGVLALSFDNDLEADSAGTDTIRELLDQFGVKGSWCVVGEWVRRYPDIYRRLLQSGHELVNHTATHPRNLDLRPGDDRKFAHVSTSERVDEISRCHTIVRDVLGCEMRGFRAPHFSVSRDAYRILAAQKYLYSSSMLYYRDQALGAVHDTAEGVLEMPLLAAPVAPFLVPASYYIWRSPIRLYRSEKDFFEQFTALVKLSAERRLITTIYLDPCDAVQFKNPPLADYLKAALDSGVELRRMCDVAVWFRTGKWPSEDLKLAAEK